MSHNYIKLYKIYLKKKYIYIKERKTMLQVYLYLRQKKIALLTHLKKKKKYPFPNLTNFYNPY